MALTTFVIYDTTTGEIHHVRNGDDGDTPSVPAGHTFLDAGLQNPKPTRKTHKVNLAGPTVEAKTSGEQQSETIATRKREIEMALATLDNLKATLNLRGFTAAEADVDAQITALETEYATYP